MKTASSFLAKVLKNVLFAFMLKDNMNINVNSNFANSHYHGTSRSKVKLRTIKNEGIPIPKVDISKKNKRTRLWGPVWAQKVVVTSVRYSFFLIFQIFEILSSHLKMGQLVWRVYLIHFKDMKKTLKQLHPNRHNTMFLWHGAFCILLE